MGGISRHAGHRTGSLGEDGDQFIIEGHPAEEEVLAAVNAYLVAEWETDAVESVDALTIRRS